MQFRKFHRCSSLLEKGDLSIAIVAEKESISFSPRSHVAVLLAHEAFGLWFLAVERPISLCSDWKCSVAEAVVMNLLCRCLIERQIMCQYLS